MTGESERIFELIERREAAPFEPDALYERCLAITKGRHSEASLTAQQNFAHFLSAFASAITYVQTHELDLGAYSLINLTPPHPESDSLVWKFVAKRAKFQHSSTRYDNGTRLPYTAHEVNYRIKRQAANETVVQSFLCNSHDNLEVVRTIYKKEADWEPTEEPEQFYNVRSSSVPLGALALDSVSIEYTLVTGNIAQD